MLLAMLSYDAHVARLFGKDPETIFELILMLRDARSNCFALRALFIYAPFLSSYSCSYVHASFHGPTTASTLTSCPPRTQ